jgi:hypothetical protein
MKRALRNIRTGRLQRSLALAAGLSSLPLAFEIYLEHYKGSFADRWEWSPIVLTPPLLAAGVAGALPGGERVARTALPATGALYALNGVVGTVLHVRGVARKPGGFSEPTYNLVMGPPLLAPGSLMLVGGMAMLAPLMRRER